MKRAALIAGVASLAWIAPAAKASILYASANDTSGPVATENVYTVDQVFGAASLLGNSGLASPLDLTSDWRPSSPRLWICNSLTNQLFTMDPATGAGSLVGGFGTTFNMQSIAFDAVSGRLFGTTVIDELFEINPDTGAASFIGVVNRGGILALGFSLSGTLYGVSDVSGELITIKTDTAVASAIAPIGIDDVTDLAARPEDGVMFAVSAATDLIYTVDLGTGIPTTVGPYGAGANFIVGLAFGAIPEPSTVTFFAVGVLSLLRRRR